MVVGFCAVHNCHDLRICVCMGALWGCLCRQLMELTAVFGVVVASSLGILGPLISCGFI